MRVVAGELRGRVIESPSDRTTRPTTDRVRESMFSSLFSRLGAFEGLQVLDAFAGSGALGIEALSRGASHCVFCERDADARRVLEGNLSSLSLGPASSTVRAVDVLEQAPSSLAAHGPFDLMLLDPPYALPPAQVLAFLDGLADAGALACGCVVAYEHALSSKDDVSGQFGNSGRFETSGQKKYGKIGVSYFEYGA